MKLLVDIGNSAVKWCMQRNKDIEDVHTLSCVSGISREYQQLKSNWQALDKPEAVYISNVAGQSVREKVNEVCLDLWHLLPDYLQVTSESCGVKNGYKNIQQLGTDRWAAIIAVWQLYKKPACIIDCGTAMTIDGISPDGEYLGGLIVPGLELMQKALSLNTDALVPVSNINPRDEFANNTEEGQYSGCVLACVALVERMLDKMKKSYGSQVVGVISGGAANVINSMIADKLVYHEHLVLTGLSLHAGENP